MTSHNFDPKLTPIPPLLTYRNAFTLLITRIIGIQDCLHVQTLLYNHQMVLYILTGYRVLSIVYLKQLQGARHTHISFHDTPDTYMMTLKQLHPSIKLSREVNPLFTISNIGHYFKIHIYLSMLFFSLVFLVINFLQISEICCNTF